MNLRALGMNSPPYAQCFASYLRGRGVTGRGGGMHGFLGRIIQRSRAIFTAARPRLRIFRLMSRRPLLRRRAGQGFGTCGLPAEAYARQYGRRANARRGSDQPVETRKAPRLAVFLRTAAKWGAVLSRGHGGVLLCRDGRLRGGRFLSGVFQDLPFPCADAFYLPAVHHGQQ